MTTTFNNIEFTEVSYIPQGETERTNGLLIHDLNDQFRDGDGCIYGFELPTNEEEAQAIMDSDEARYLDGWEETLDTVEII